MLAFVFVCFGWYVRGQTPTFTIALGKIAPNEQEAQECYFPVATGHAAAYVIVHPDSIGCVRLRELVGRSVRLQVVVEE